jgi:hypothetical protein
MAVNVKKLIADAKAAQEAARIAAEEAQGKASKESIDSETRARSKNQLDYANTLKPRLIDYEEQLKFWANKIARGDKLSTIEQKEFDKLVKDYSSLNKTVDAAIKKSNDIIVEARRKVALKPPVSTQTQTDAGAPTGTPAVAPSLQTKPDEKPKTPAQTDKLKIKTTPPAAYTTKEAADLAKTVGGTNYFSAKYGTATDTTDVTVAATPLDTLLAKTDFWYDLPDYIFKIDVDPKTGEPGEIGRLLQEAVTGDWQNPKFLSKLQLTKWWQRNAPTLRTRIIDREKYNDLKAAGEDVTKSEYGLYLSKQMRSVKAKAKEIAGVTLTDEQAQSVAQKIYDGFLDDDPLAINALITPFIGKVTSIVGTGTAGKQSGFSGQALQNYQTLQGIAKANGFSLKDILPNISAVTAGGDLETAVLRALANGDIDINRVAQDARMLAAQGQPQYVRDLLGQGYDLQAIYSPYRQTMASVLELNADEIDLNDSTLRMAITDKGDMNLYDFKKALRKDNRWQYTENARDEVASSTLQVLRDFGFQG